MHMAAIEQALRDLLQFKPDLLLVSAGFDAYAHDPIMQMTLSRKILRPCGTWLRETNVPAGAILEGGYSDELPELNRRLSQRMERPLILTAERKKSEIQILRALRVFVVN